MLYKNINKKILLFIDTETTGLSPRQGDGIIELGALKVLNKIEMEIFDTYVNPKIPISPNAQAIHGINDLFIYKHGKPLEYVMPKFFNFCISSPKKQQIKFDFYEKNLREKSKKNKSQLININENKLKINNIKNNIILIGHNFKNFDLQFLNKHLSEQNLPFLNFPIIDTLYLSKQKLNLPNHKLQTLAWYFNIDYSKAHKAIIDAKITKEIFFKLLDL
jgi:DNA polymerase III epsilon subunit-like protein